MFSPSRAPLSPDKIPATSSSPASLVPSIRKRNCCVGFSGFYLVDNGGSRASTSRGQKSRIRRQNSKRGWVEPGSAARYFWNKFSEVSKNLWRRYCRSEKKVNFQPVSYFCSNWSKGESEESTTSYKYYCLSPQATLFLGNGTHNGHLDRFVARARRGQLQPAIGTPGGGGSFLHASTVNSFPLMTPAYYEKHQHSPRLQEHCNSDHA